MTFEVADSLRILQRRYEWRLDAGAPVYDQGAQTGHFYLVIEGRIIFEVVDAAGLRSVVHEANAGDTLGVISAFTDRPTSAAASAGDPTVLLAIPVAEAVEAFRASPELAIEVIEQLANEGQRRARQVTDSVDDPASNAQPPVAAPPPPAVDVDVPLRAPFDEEALFVDDMECPVSGTTFQYLRVRAGRVRPISRASDFQVIYRDIDPTQYSIIVCPQCSYAAYLDDFHDLGATERRDLVANQTVRDAFGQPYLCGERTLDQAKVSFELALSAYRVRGTGSRREAGLLHRLGWLERERPNPAEEQRLLRDARNAYRDAYERDSDMSDAAAMRAAYIIGDLSMRVGDVQEAGRWLLSCIQAPDADQQSGLVRMARERLHDAREQAASDAPAA